MEDCRPLLSATDSIQQENDISGTIPDTDFSMIKDSLSKDYGKDCKEYGNHVDIVSLATDNSVNDSYTDSYAESDVESHSDLTSADYFQPPAYNTTQHSIYDHEPKYPQIYINNEAPPVSAPAPTPNSSYITSHGIGAPRNATYNDASYFQYTSNPNVQYANIFGISAQHATKHVTRHVELHAEQKTVSFEDRLQYLYYPQNHGLAGFIKKTNNDISEFKIRISPNMHQYFTKYPIKGIQMKQSNIPLYAANKVAKAHRHGLTFDICFGNVEEIDVISAIRQTKNLKINAYNVMLALQEMERRYIMHLLKCQKFYTVNSEYDNGHYTKFEITFDKKFLNYLRGLCRGSYWDDLSLVFLQLQPTGWWHSRNFNVNDEIVDLVAHGDNVDTPIILHIANLVEKLAQQYVLTSYEKNIYFGQLNRLAC